MKLILSLFILFICTKLFAQNFDCDPYYENYCRNHPCTEEIDAFCEGVEIGLKSKQLEIWEKGGYPFNSNPCLKHSYEKWGIKLKLFGNDIISSEKEEYLEGVSEGFNYIMLPQIKSKLGKDYIKLGKIDSSWFEISNSTLLNIYKNITINLVKDSIAQIKFNERKFKDAQIENLQGVTFIDFLSKKVISYNEIRKGVNIKVQVSGSTGRAWLRLNFEKHSNPLVCKCGHLYNLPIRFKIK